MVSLSFIYHDDIFYVEKLLSLGEEALKSISGKYSLMNHDNNKSYYECPIHEILYDFIMKADSDYINKYYQTLLSKYGNKAVDIIVVKDENIVRNKIIDVIKLLMEITSNDKVLIKLPFISNIYDTLSMPSVIYSTIIEHFKVNKRCSKNRAYYVEIERN